MRVFQKPNCQHTSYIPADFIKIIIISEKFIGPSILIEFVKTESNQQNWKELTTITLKKAQNFRAEATYFKYVFNRKIHVAHQI